MAADNGFRAGTFIANLLQNTRKSALMLPSTKAAVYWLVVVVGSFIHDFLPPPDTYFSNKRNVFNVYFVKLGWGWTLGLMTPFVCVTSFVYTSCDLRVMLKHCSRLAVATFGWYFWVNLFVYIEELTGFCEGEEALISKKTCHVEGYHWEGVDISGHAFLLIYSALVISEEIQVKKLWSDIAYYGVDNKGNISRDLETLLSKHGIATPFVEAIFLCSSLLLILWELMLVSTTVYFHSVYQKVLGALIAIFTWHVTYGFWFHYDNISPGLPLAIRD